jgi:hypothetical protein
MDERDDVKQLTFYCKEFLEYNPMKTNVEKVYNIYLQHHPLEMKIQSCPNAMHNNFTPSSIAMPN